ncbi:unnamed protein product, partial [Amoebophrya sp. A120]
RTLLLDSLQNELGVLPSRPETTTESKAASTACFAQSVSTIFTWGEALSPAVSNGYVKRNIQIFELLIATEYWLCLYRRLGGNGSSTRNYTTTTIQEHTSSLFRSAQLGLSGDKTTSSTQQLEARTEKNRISCSEEAKYFRTNDLVKVTRTACGQHELHYHGRLDEYAKVGGKWVDIREIVTKIEGL